MLIGTDEVTVNDAPLGKILSNPNPGGCCSGQSSLIDLKSGCNGVYCSLNFADGDVTCEWTGNSENQLVFQTHPANFADGKRCSGSKYPGFKDVSEGPDALTKSVPCRP